MASVLATVSDYLTTARVLLQDTSAGAYRYSDQELITALNLGLSEARRLRPDFFIDTPDDVPLYTSGGNTVVFPVMYRTALLYYVVGHAQLRDEEDTQDARASGLLNKFVSQLLVVQA